MPMGFDRNNNESVDHFGSMDILTMLSFLVHNYRMSVYFYFLWISAMFYSFQSPWLSLFLNILSFLMLSGSGENQGTPETASVPSLLYTISCIHVDFYFLLSFCLDWTGPFCCFLVELSPPTRFCNSQLLPHGHRNGWNPQSVPTLVKSASTWHVGHPFGTYFSIPL